jgi:hypothetical protein
MKLKWKKKPEEHDYPAAASYLNLIFDNKTVSSLVKQLKKAPLTSHKAKDILRASGLSPLGMSNYHVKVDMKKIVSGIPVSPILLVRDKANGRVIIADGYHRLCAMHMMDEDALVLGKIV